MILEGGGYQVGDNAVLNFEAIDEAGVFVGVVGIDWDDVTAVVVGLPRIREDGRLAALAPGRNTEADAGADVVVVGDNVAAGDEAGVVGRLAGREDDRSWGNDAGAGDGDVDDRRPISIYGLEFDEVHERAGGGDGHVDARPVGVGESGIAIGSAVFGI